MENNDNPEENKEELAKKLEDLAVTKKKKKKQKKKATAGETKEPSDRQDVIQAVQTKTAALDPKTLQLLQPSSSSAAKDLSEAKQHTYKFWSSQPVPKLDERITENTFIQPPVDQSQIRSEPFSLPEPFVWSDVDILDDTALDEL